MNYRMMKKINGNVVIKVTKHLIMKNYHEVFVTDQMEDDKHVCYVLGKENDFACLSADELEMHKLLELDLYTIFPATGWEWN